MSNFYRDFITSHPLDTFLYAIKHGYPKLVQESQERALSQDPVGAFRIASEHNLVDVACMVAERSLRFQPDKLYVDAYIPEAFRRGAIALQTNQIFSVLKYALKHNREDLMDLAASVSVEDPKFTLAADQLTDYETLAAWVSQNNKSRVTVLKELFESCATMTNLNKMHTGLG